MALWLGTKSKEEEPNPERRKAQAALTKPTKPKRLSRPRLYGLTRDIEIYTPLGPVEAKAGDTLVLFKQDGQIRVTPPEHVPEDWQMKVCEKPEEWAAYLATEDQ